jgi:uncharacterized protein YbbC (DUF1343 family)
MRMGLEIAAILQKKYPSNFETAKTVLLLGNEETVSQLQAGTPPAQIISGWARDLAAFDQVRQKYLLYR